MALVDEEIQSRRIPQAEITRQFPLDPSAYNAWRNGKSKLRIEQAMTISEFLGWRPAWALFGEGPKTDEEAAKWDKLQVLIDKLAAIPALQTPLPALQSSEQQKVPSRASSGSTTIEPHEAFVPPSPVDSAVKKNRKPGEPDKDN